MGNNRIIWVSLLKGLVIEHLYSVVESFQRFKRRESIGYHLSHCGLHRTVGSEPAVIVVNFVNYFVVASFWHFLFPPAIWFIVHVPLPLWLLAPLAYCPDLDCPKVGD